MRSYAETKVQQFSEARILILSCQPDLVEGGRSKRPGFDKLTLTLSILIHGFDVKNYSL